MEGKRGVEVYVIDAEVFRNLGMTQEWQETTIGRGMGIEYSAPKSRAWYFTAWVERVVSGDVSVALPPYAAVYIPPEVDHSMRGVQGGMNSAIVGHLHEGHGVHAVGDE